MSDSLSTVAAALIGAGIGVVSLVISKENKISEFRQQWIDGLRSDVSSLIGIASAMQVRPIETASHFRDLMLRLHEFNCRIELRFKKDDVQATSLLDAVRELVLFADRMESSHSFYLRVIAVQAAAQLVLKDEWEGVKAGEKNYRRTLRYSQFLGMTLAILFTGWFCVEYILIPLSRWLPELFKG